MTPTLTTDLATLPTGRLAAADIEADQPRSTSWPRFSRR